MNLTPETARRLRKSWRLTQRQVCEYLHIGRKTWSNYERGTSKPSQAIILLVHLFDASRTNIICDCGRRINRFYPFEILKDK